MSVGAQARLTGARNFSRISAPVGAGLVAKLRHGLEHPTIVLVARRTAAQMRGESGELACRIASGPLHLDVAMQDLEPGSTARVGLVGVEKRVDVPTLPHVEPLRAVRVGRTAQ